VSDARPATARTRIAEALDGDEQFDEGAADLDVPPISVPRYRRVARLLIRPDIADEITPPDGFDADGLAAFEAGVLATVDYLTGKAAAILTAELQPRPPDQRRPPIGG